METPKFISLNGAVVPWQQGVCHHWTETAQRGLNVFDALRGYYDKNSDSMRIVGLEEHLMRLLRSAEKLNFPKIVGFSDLKKAIADLIGALELRENIYVRPTIFIEKNGYELTLDKIKAGYYIVIVPVSSQEGIPKSNSAIISGCRKIPESCFPSSVKSGATYAVSRNARLEALRMGVDEAILLNYDGNICETPGANIFVVMGGSVFTPPISDGALDGITKRHLCQLIESTFEMSVCEKSVHSTTVGSWEEVFLSGTLAEIISVTKVDGANIGSGAIGPIAARLASIYYSMCSGKIDAPASWISKVKVSNGKFI